MTVLDDLLAEVGERTVALATAVAPAVRVEPRLLRRARLVLTPRLTVADEAELWFSPLVAARGATGFVLEDDVLATLRGQLARDPVALGRARAVTEWAHAAAPATVRLEELVIAETLGGASAARLDALLAQALATMARRPDRARGVARWAARAVPALPHRARDGQAAQLLWAGAHARLGAPAPLGGGLAPAELGWALPEDGERVAVGVRLLRGGIEVSEPPLPEAHIVRLPLTSPLTLSVRPARAAGGERVIDVARGAVEAVAVGTGTTVAEAGAEILLADGRAFSLEPARAAPTAAASEVWPGRPFPLGATWDGEGTNFSLFSEHGERVELCLFDAEDRETRVDVPNRTAMNWHCFLPDVGPGQRYGYRVHGRYEPAEGYRFNPAKLLIDPYALAIEGPVDFDAANVLPYVPSEEDDADLELDDEDSAPAIPKCVVSETGFDWEGDRPPRVPWNETVIYEVHVKGFTKLRPDVPEELRGAYAGLASAPALDHLRDLGVTAIELLPVHQIADEEFLHPKGLTNYMGYSTIGFFAPHSGYAAMGVRGEQVREFKELVKALHRAGFEVILDVVYNHTAEGNHLGPMLSFKGVDNKSYYRLMPDDPRHYMDFTGTGNSFNVVHPSVLRLIIDSLRYWVTECHVDGFRFDLASALAREFYDVDRLSAFFDTIHQDPILSQVKLIAEPWDVGPGGYQVGNFPVLWSEWNGIYRDVVRDFWRGQASLAEFARRFIGSSDLYQDDGRHPYASINFVTAHDGFTLHDLVTYNQKHNEANQEDNRDGTDDNRSWNCGAEGETDDPEVNALRARQQRNFLTTLLLSQGTPMLLGGDEFSRTQGGNNNGWSQDNEISWLDWDWTPAGAALHGFVKRLIELRRSHPVFRRTSFLTGEAAPGADLPDVSWFGPDGKRLSTRDWDDAERRAIGLFLNGEMGSETSATGATVDDDSFLVLFNAGAEDIDFRLPARRFGPEWELELSTAAPEAPPGAWNVPAGGVVGVEARSVTVLAGVGDAAL